MATCDNPGCAREAGRRVGGGKVFCSSGCALAWAHRVPADDPAYDSDAMDAIEAPEPHHNTARRGQPFRGRGGGDSTEGGEA